MLTPAGNQWWEQEIHEDSRLWINKYDFHSTKIRNLNESPSLCLTLGHRDSHWQSAHRYRTDQLWSQVTVYAVFPSLSWFRMRMQRSASLASHFDSLGKTRWVVWKLLWLDYSSRLTLNLSRDLSSVLCKLTKVLWTAVSFLVAESFLDFPLRSGTDVREFSLGITSRFFHLVMGWVIYSKQDEQSMRCTSIKFSPLPSAWSWVELGTKHVHT